jgi:transposase
MLSHLSFTLNQDQHVDRLNVGIDMGKNKWVMDALDTANGKHHRHVFTGPSHLGDALGKVAELVSTGREVDVICEAGRNGFTPARMMAAAGARVTIVPVNKLEVVNTGKKVKSDRIDARVLSERDTRAAGFPSVWVPSIDQECRRRALREEQRLSKDIKRNNNRILGILERWPLASDSRHLPAAAWREHIDQWRRQELIGRALPETELACICNLVAELEVQENNLVEWQKRTAVELQEERDTAVKVGNAHPVDILMEYKGIGEQIARGLVWYVGDVGRFANGKKFASYVGLVPVPYESGQMSRCQGISKSGNPDLRRKLIELAWLWVRYQPDSPITRKWAPALARKGRGRKTAIVAVARQLAVALFRLLKHGQPLEGAVKNRPIPVPAATPGSPLAA